MATAQEIAKATWDAKIPNSWGDEPLAKEILAAIEQRVAVGFQDVLAKLDAAHTPPADGA